MAAAPPIPIRSAFVLGSTSEVAKAICQELGRRGCQRFHLVARNGEANQQLAAELQQRFGAAVSTETTDLLADAALEPARRPEVGEFDLYLITAGSLGDAELARSDSAEALRITAANCATAEISLAPRRRRRAPASPAAALAGIVVKQVYVSRLRAYICACV